MVRDATVGHSDKEMHAALEINIPRYATTIVTTNVVTTNAVTTNAVTTDDIIDLMSSAYA